VYGFCDSNVRPDSASTDLPPMSIWNRSMDRRYAAPAALPCPILRLTMTSSGGSAVPGPGRVESVLNAVPDE